MLSKSTNRSSSLIALILTTIVGSVILYGCGATQQSNLWVDPTYHSTPMKRSW